MTDTALAAVAPAAAAAAAPAVSPELIAPASAPTPAAAAPAATPVLAAAPALIGAGEAFELAALAFPDMAGRLNPLAEQLKGGMTEAQFSKALLGARASTSAPVDTRAENAVKPPEKASGANANIDATGIYSSRAQAMNAN